MRLLNKKGFTLMELLIVIAIIAILTVSFLPNALKAPAKARDAARVKRMSNIQAAVEAYYAEKGSIPTSSEDPANCFTDAIAQSIGMDKAPLSGNALGNCAAADDVANSDFFYYRAKADGPIKDRFYILATLVEVSASANSTAVRALAQNNGFINTAFARADIREPIFDNYNTLAEVKLLIPAVKPANGTSYIAVGPM